MNVDSILLITSLIIIFGYISEWLFKKINIPDSLMLIVFGFLLSPSVFNIIDPVSINRLAPLFTTFTLLFLMFDGALYIDLKSFGQGIGSGIIIAVFNFIISSIIVAAIFYFFIQNLLLSITLGFSLGGVSSAYIITLLKQLETKKQIYSILTVESAITDVMSIVLALTMIELSILNRFSFKNICSQIASLFSIAGVVGIVAGYFWYLLETKIIGKDRNYMLTVSYIVLIYVIVEYLGGNGALAALFLGIMLANSHTIINYLSNLRKRKRKTEDKNVPSAGEEKIISKQEKLFYNELSFFLKTFFFVYIGLLLDLRNLKVVLIGTIVALAIMLFRTLTSIVTKKFDPWHRKLINSLFARGIAPAAIILTAVKREVLTDPMIIDTVYFIITATIILSSIKVFLLQKYKQAKN